MSCEYDMNFHGAASTKDTYYRSTSTDSGHESYKSSVSRDMLLPNVFVQIPRNHLVAPSLAKGPIARQCDEIKAEPPIKSEIENIQNSAGHRFNNKDVENGPTNQFLSPSISPATTTSSPNLVTARPKSAAAVKCFKCTLCPFMSISQSGYDGHLVNVHANQSESANGTDRMQRNKILCPGCENVFYSKRSLKIHLANDHQMSSTELMPLLESLYTQSDQKTKKSTNRKQKIYLKNVEKLKNPKFGSNQFTHHETINSTSDQMQSNDSNAVQSTNEFLFDGEFGQVENRMCDLIADLEPSYSLTDLTSVTESVSSVSDSIPVTPDDTQSLRPDSGNSIKYCDNMNMNMAMTSNDGWTNSNIHFENYDRSTSNWNFISEKRSTSHSTSPMPIISTPATSFSGVCHNEKKKIFIKNIDILKEPLITPTSAFKASESPNNRKHIHLRTVDEVNLMLSNKVETETHSYSTPTEIITLDDDNYHYVLNDGVDYNSAIIPQYFESDMNDLVSSYLPTPDYIPNYSTPNLSNLTNLDAVTPMNNNNNCDGAVIILDANESNVVEEHRQNEDYPMAYYDRPMNVDVSHDVIDYESQNNKFIQSRTMDGPDYMIVPSTTIVDPTDDILDLTNDEVEQMIDNNLIASQCLGGFTTTTTESEAQIGRGRINVVGNLMRSNFVAATIDVMDHISDVPQIDLADDDDSGGPSTSGDRLSQAKKRSGRPKGARKTSCGVTAKVNALPYKCRIENCAMRFASENVLAMHEQCHDTSSTDTEFRCPKCDNDNTEAPKKWIYNTLATHLWREHSIDLELYSCTYPDCNFKTPILSRLKNTHMKIHSDAKDFKCSQCDKAFKNAKQLKNHRRIHSKIVPIRIRQCPHCNQSYSAHYIREHMLTHATPTAAVTASIDAPCKDNKEFKCVDCAYHSLDRNAFRRHRMVHSKEMKYKCPLCSFQAIQSINYKNHVIKKHPDSAKELIFMCEQCNFVTVNKNLYYVHCLNHNKTSFS